MNKQSRLIVFMPILMAIATIFGIFIGKNLPSGSTSEKKNGIFSGTGSKNDKLNQIIGLIEDEYVDTVNTSQLTDEAIATLLEQLDPHSAYIPPVDLQGVNEDMEGNFDGIGIEFNIVNDTIVVVAAISGGPSEALGIRSGDRIVTIEGKNVAGVKIKNDDVIKTLRGKKGTKVKVEISRKSVKELIPYTITRDKIPIYSLDAAYMVNDKIGYIKLNRFAETTFDEYYDAFQKLRKQGMEKMILDLRGNPGGYLNIAIALADEFLKKNEMIVYTEGRSRKREDYKATSEGEFENQPLVILIDEGSASASEIVAGSMQDNDRATIIGRRSFGKGLVQEQFEFKDGSAMRLTVARYYTASGRCIQRSYAEGTEKYYEEIYSEILNKDPKHENNKGDTIHKFKTKGGRVVYGGGGIAPDVYVPYDTSGYTKYYSDVISKGVSYDFCFEYADRNRNTLTKKYTDYKTFGADMNLGNKILDEFVDYAAKNGLPRNDAQIRKSRLWLINRLQSLIARNLWKNEGFYYIINKDDNFMHAALKRLNRE
jgi:carboxyl-terminal processing protease